MTAEPRVVVTGSVAFDYLMRFPGRFLEHILPDRLDRVSVSFLVDDMRRVRGGCGPNIAYGMAQFGRRPILLAAAGTDSADYREWLGLQGVDVTRLAIFDDVFTASFFVTTDDDQNQIASFYTGAMARARVRELSISAISAEEISCVIISPNDPVAMARYADECREARIPFLYDPSQQVARLSGTELSAGMRGADALLCNDYEFGVIANKTGVDPETVLDSVGTLIVTHGADGSTIRWRGGEARIPPARLTGVAVDPTGVGDAYRGALLASREAGLSWEVGGRIASVAAVYCLEHIGPQAPRFRPPDFLDRYRANFGDPEEARRVFSPDLT